VITDIDVKPLEAGETQEIDDAANPGSKIRVAFTHAEIDARIATVNKRKVDKSTSQVVKTFVSPYWTLEYCIARSLKLRKLFYRSVLEALLEQKIDEGVQALQPYHNAIADIENHFANWTEPAETIAFSITQHIIHGFTTLQVAKDEISKAIIAQHFASNLKADNTIIDYKTELSLDYIFKAIEYAASN
jgi:putative ATP-dependent endonuclease of the OLD family